MNFLKKNPFLVLGIVLIVLGGILVGSTYLNQNPMSDRGDTVSDTQYAYEADIKFEIADTPAKQSLGLSGRKDVPDDYGMLFVFPTPRIAGFWMKDMFVSIDIIWLSDTGVIEGIEHSVSPKTYPDVFNPPVPISYVLETRAGYAMERGWKVGDTITLPNLK